VTNQIITIVKEDWRYWYRSKVATVMMLITLLLAIASSLTTYASIETASHQRLHLQQQSESAFLEQPDRHPHRMVHYGHYVFRAPAPLSIIDPGVDLYTGTTIFLEGHRQNSTMFSSQQLSSGLSRLGNLTPAFLMQVLVPLLLILVGYSTISRERESGTIQFILSQGISATTFILGKLCSLMLVGAVFTLPILIASIYTLVQGESLVVILTFIMTHLLYLLVWCGIVIACSSLSKKSNSSFVLLVAVWIFFSLLLPRIAASTAASMKPSPSKLEADFEVLKELRKLGDGHNASDPAFEQLKAKLLDQYKVEQVEELPVNFRGVVAQKSEADLTHVLNQFAEKRMSEELEQAKIARVFGWLSPTIALRTTSMMLAGTNLETHHRFLRVAEKVRFEFVQGLNKVHEKTLSYQDDINRYKDSETQQKARVSSENWSLLNDFRFTIDKPQIRLASSIESVIHLVFWIGLIVFLLTFSRRALQ